MKAVPSATRGEWRIVMITINYEGKIYDEELVRSYYDSNISERVSSDVETAQEFFEEYIKLDPSFTDLFEYDFNPIVMGNHNSVSVFQPRSKEKNNEYDEIINYFDSLPIRERRRAKVDVIEYLEDNFPKKL